MQISKIIPKDLHIVYILQKNVQTCKCDIKQKGENFCDMSILKKEKKPALLSFFSTNYLYPHYLHILGKSLSST